MNLDNNLNDILYKVNLHLDIWDVEEPSDLEDFEEDKLYRKLKMYVYTSVSIIKNYLNNASISSDFVLLNFQDAISLIVVNSYEGKKSSNVKQVTRGSKSVTYHEDKVFRITPEIKALLPAPYIKLFH